MVLEFVERGIVRPEFGEVLRAAERVEIGEYRIALDMPRIGDLNMQWVGIHAHDFLPHLLLAVCEVDAVAERLAHLGLAVGTGKAPAGIVVRQEYLRLHKHGGIDGIELAHDLARLLDHGLLILAHRHGSRLECRDVCRLAYRIAEETHGDAGTVLARIVALCEAAQLYLLFHGRIALEPLHGHEIHIIERKLGKLADLRLYEKRRLLRVETRRHIVQRDLDYVLPDLFGVVGIVRQRLGVGDHYIDLVVFSAVLEFHPAAQGTHIVSDMEPTRRTVAGKDNLSHQSLTFLSSSRTFASISSHSSTLSLSSCFTATAPCASFSSL